MLLHSYRPLQWFRGFLEQIMSLIEIEAVVVSVDQRGGQRGDQSGVIVVVVDIDQFRFYLMIST